MPVLAAAISGRFGGVFDAWLVICAWRVAQPIFWWWAWCRRTKELAQPELVRSMA